MRRFLLPEGWTGAPTCTLDGDKAHYLSRVLRLGAGDSFPAMDAAARRYQCTILESEGGRVLLSVTPIPATAPDRPEIILVQALPKGTKMDLIVRQATEAGVSVLIPLLSRHCVSRPVAGSESATKKARWERIVREALQQSGSDIPTAVHDIVPIRDLAAVLDAECGPAQARLSLLLHETPLEKTSLHGYLGTSPARVILCVGPEGGFAPDETAQLQDAGFRIMHFAGAVFRTETAALYAVAAVQTILSERTSWMPV